MAMLAKFRNNRYVDGAFYGIRPASVGLIIAAGLLVAKITFFLEGALAVGALSWKAVLLAAVLLVLTRWVKPTKKLHPVVFIAASAVVGVLFSF
jgi:chromate transporter